MSDLSANHTAGESGQASGQGQEHDYQAEVNGEIASAEGRVVPQPVKPYSFVLGALASLLAIPLVMILSGFLGFMGIRFAVAFAGFGMLMAFALFAKGSRRSPVVNKGFAFSILVGSFATLFGILAGFTLNVFSAFDAVGGKGGFFGSVFAGRVAYRLAEHPEELFVPGGLALVFAIGGIVMNVKEARKSRLVAEHAPAVQQSNSAAPDHPTRLNAPSSGIVLNGKPLGEPEPKKRFWQ